MGADGNYTKCPFCGGVARQATDTNIVNGQFVEKHRICCTKCGCTTPQCVTLSEAIIKWETRQPVKQ
ncbi:MAG: hypothetical protein J6Y89_06670 [Lachnospiraceae bacterium]|nr:hypothetical protein [Lachnospiraceae bacterium]